MRNKFEKILFFSFILIGLVCAGSITGTVFDSETGLELENVQVSTTGQMDACDYEIYIDELSVERRILPITQVNRNFGELYFKDISAIAPLVCSFRFTHILDGDIIIPVTTASPQTHIFSDGKNLTIELHGISFGQLTQKQFTDFSGEFILRGLKDDYFTLQFSKEGYNEFEYGPILIDNSNPTRTNRLIPDGILKMYSDASIPDIPQGSIAGYVEDVDGNPLRNVRVEAYFDGVVVQTKFTNTAGFFNLTELDYSGIYTIKFIPSLDNCITETKTVNLDLSIQPNVSFPNPIQLICIQGTTEIWGYVKDIEGNLIPNAAVNIPFFNLFGITNNAGFYRIREVPVNYPFEAYAQAINYFESSVRTLTISEEGMEYNFTLTFNPNYVQGNGSLEGYVFDNDGNPLRSSNVEIAGRSAVTDSNGYYIIDNIPEGFNQRAIASRSGYRSSSENVHIYAGIITRQNFELQETHTSSGGGSSGSTSSSLTPPISTAQSTITPPHSSFKTEYLDGCPIEILREIKREKDETKITLKLTNKCNRSITFELREYVPEEAVLADISYSIKPARIFLRPLTLIWEIHNLKPDETSTFVYTINKEIESDEFEAKIFKLEKEEAIKIFELLAPRSALLEDEITLTLRDLDKLPVSEWEIIVILPSGEEEILITNKEGKAYLILEEEGKYTFDLKNAELKEVVSTEVSEIKKQDPVPIIAEIEEEKEEQLFLIALFGEIGDSWPIFIGLIFAVLVILGIVMYFVKTTNSEEIKEQRPLSEEISEKQIQGEATILEEISAMQIPSEETTLFEEIKKREIKKTKKKPTSVKKKGPSKKRK